jgi:hypothetical protein
MPWIKLDDGIALHPKFTTIGAEASWFWVCGLSYSARYLTDGFIPENTLGVLGIGKRYKKHVAALVSVGLWDIVEGGYRIHDYHDYQPSKDDIEQRREYRREAGRIGGQRSGDVRREQSPFRDVAAVDKIRATKLVQLAIGRGELTPQPCEVCDDVKTDAHHTDYSKPLDVRWLCRQHHTEEHARLRKQVASSGENPLPVPAHPERVTKNVTLSQRERAPGIHERTNARIQNPMDPVPLWDWQFAKFRNALRPKFGDDAYTEVSAWMHRVGDELLKSGAPVDVSDPVKWWDARYAADWGAGAGDELAAFRKLGRTAS